MFYDFIFSWFRRKTEQLFRGLKKKNDEEEPLLCEKKNDEERSEVESKVTKMLKWKIGKKVIVVTIILFFFLCLNTIPRPMSHPMSDTMFNNPPPQPESMSAQDLLLTSFVLKTAAALEKHNVTYWIDFGTAVGSFRDGGVVPGDYDTDLTILGGWEEMKNAFLAIKAELPAEEFRVEACFYNECHLDWVWETKPEKTSVDALNPINLEVCSADRPECHNPDLDIFPIIEHDDGFLWRTDCFRDFSADAILPGYEHKKSSWAPVEKKLIFPLKKIHFGPEQMLVNVPGQLEKYLNFRYGYLGRDAEYIRSKDLYVKKST